MAELRPIKISDEDMLEAREALKMVLDDMDEEDRNVSMVIPFLKNAVKYGEEEADLDDPAEAGLLDLCRLMLEPLTEKTIDEVLYLVVELARIYAEREISSEQPED